MNFKLYKYKLVLMLLGVCLASQILAQTPVSPPPAPNPPDLDAVLKTLDTKLKDVDKVVSAQLGKLEFDLKHLENLDTREIFSSRNLEQTDPQRAINTSEKVKRIIRSFAANRKDKLSINNQFGKVVVNVWSKNEIKVEIEIKAFDATEEEAQKLLEMVDISESKTNDLISFKTNIQRGYGGSRGDKQGISVNYTINMPKSNPLDVVNKYGNVILPDFEGPVKIVNTYGSLVATELNNAANYIEVKYGSASIGKIAEGRLNIAYGSLKIDEANSVNADVQYGSTKITRLLKGGNFENKYGSIKIDGLENLSDNTLISAQMGSVTVGVNPSLNFDFDVSVNMGGFHTSDDKVTITSKTPEATGRPQFNKNYKGKYGKGSDVKLIIKSNYGSVKIN